MAGSPIEVEAGAPALLVAIDQIDLTARILDRKGLETLIPHRGEMMLLDGIVWRAEDMSCCVGVKHIGRDEFWVPGHFPGKPLFPGVLMVETGAQLAAYLWNSQMPEAQLAAFLRIDNAAFRHSVVPGDDLVLLCRQVKRGRRRFVSDVQGVVGRELAFEARVSGMALGPFDGSV